MKRFSLQPFFSAVHHVQAFRPVLFIFFFFALIGTTTLQPVAASAAQLPSGGTAQDESTKVENSDENSGCAVGFVGWIFCNASNLLSKLSDGLYAALEHLLYIDPLSRQSNGGQALYTVWSSFRSIANVIFIVLFLVIIWSHITGAGISNYNIKRMLPRLIVNVILINASYYVGILVVDIANVAGSSLKSVLDGIANTTNYHPELQGWGNVTTLIIGGLAVAAAVTALVYIFAASILPLLLSVIAILFTVVLILIARQAIIVALIIISPIAFALNVLPNTQKWFSKWWNTLFTAAMIYPIVALVAGGGSVAANIIRSGAGDDTSLPTMIFALLGMAAEIIPLIVVPKLIKSSSGILAGIANAANKISQGSLSPLQQRSQMFAERKDGERRINNIGKRNLMGVYARTRANRSRRAKELDKELGNGGRDGSTALDRFEAKNADAIARAGAADIKDADKRQRREDEINNVLQGRIIEWEVADIEAAEAVGKLENWSMDEWMKILEAPNDTVSDHLRAAAFKKMGQSGNEEMIEKAMKQLGEMSGDISIHATMLANGIDQSGIGETSAHLNSTSTGRMRSDPSLFQGGNAMDKLYTDAANAGRYTPEQLSKEKNVNIARLSHLSSTFSASTQQSLHQSQQKIVGNDTLRANMGSQAQQTLQNAQFLHPPS
ncbi:MAG: hypothetical protein ACTJG2_04120 [Candidatus Saccharimonadales bacterium]